MNIKFNGKTYDKAKLELHAHTGHFEQVDIDDVVCMGNQHNTVVGYRHESKVFLLLGTLAMAKAQEGNIKMVTKHILKKADASAVWVDPAKEVKAFPVQQRKHQAPKYR